MFDRNLVKTQQFITISNNTLFLLCSDIDQYFDSYDNIHDFPGIGVTKCFTMTMLQVMTKQDKQEISWKLCFTNFIINFYKTFQCACHLYPNKNDNSM